MTYPEDPYEPVNPLYSEVMTTAQLSNVPRPKALVGGMLNLNSLAWIAGSPGAFKTFLGVELAGCVSTGTTYRGNPVNKTTTLYVTGEGRSGLYDRILEWETVHKVATSNALWLPNAVQVGTARWDYLRDLARDVGAELIILDTQARMAGPLEENSASDMGRYIEAVDRLREATGACVASLHHSSKAGDTLRGSSAVHGAADTVIALTRMRTDDTDVCRIHCMKQKDSTEFHDYYVRPVQGQFSMTLMECEKPDGFDQWLKASRR